MRVEFLQAHTSDKEQGVPQIAGKAVPRHQGYTYKTTILLLDLASPKACIT